MSRNHLSSTLYELTSQIGGVLEGEYQIGEFALESLKDIHKIVREDLGTVEHPVTKQLDKWMFVKKDLIPLLHSLPTVSQIYLEDDKYSQKVFQYTLKILALLTNPLGENFESEQKKQHSASVIDQYKRARTIKSFFSDKNTLGVLCPFFQRAILLPPSERSDNDTAIIDLTLLLISNLLRVPDQVSFGSAQGISTNQHLQQLHIDFVRELDNSKVLDSILYLTKVTTTKVNKQHQSWNLRVLELLRLLFTDEDPILLVIQPDSKSGVSHPALPASSKAFDQVLQHEKHNKKLLKKHVAISGRHPRFGGTFVVKDSSGKAKGSFHNLVTQVDSEIRLQKTGQQLDPNTRSKTYRPRRRKSGATLGMRSSVNEAPVARRRHDNSSRTLFCTIAVTVIQQVYGSLVKRVQYEIEHNSLNLLDSDYENYLWFHAFFTSFYYYYQSCVVNDALLSSIRSKSVHSIEEKLTSLKTLLAADEKAITLRKQFPGNHDEDDEDEDFDFLDDKENQPGNSSASANSRPHHSESDDDSMDLDELMDKAAESDSEEEQTDPAQSASLQSLTSEAENDSLPLMEDSSAPLDSTLELLQSDEPVIEAFTDLGASTPSNTDYSLSIPHPSVSTAISQDMGDSVPTSNTEPAPSLQLAFFPEENQTLDDTQDVSEETQAEQVQSQSAEVSEANIQNGQDVVSEVPNSVPASLQLVFDPEQSMQPDSFMDEPAAVPQEATETPSTSPPVQECLQEQYLLQDQPIVEKCSPQEPTAPDTPAEATKEESPAQQTEIVQVAPEPKTPSTLSIPPKQDSEISSISQGQAEGPTPRNQSSTCAILPTGSILSFCTPITPSTKQHGEEPKTAEQIEAENYGIEASLPPASLQLQFNSMSIQIPSLPMEDEKLDTHMEESEENHSESISETDSEYNRRFEETKANNTKLWWDTMTKETQDMETPQNNVRKSLQAITHSVQKNCFLFVARRIDNYVSEKNWSGLETSICCLRSQLLMIDSMFHSNDASLARDARSILRDMLFDRERYYMYILPGLLREYNPNHIPLTSPYLAYLLECIHLTMRLMYNLNEEGAIFTLSKVARHTEEEETFAIDPNSVENTDQEVLDISDYCRLFVHPACIHNLCFLLDTYRSNSANVNHFLAKLFLRICSEQHAEYIFFRISVFRVFERFLYDPRTAKDAQYKELRDVCSWVVRRFHEATLKSPLLFMTILFASTTRQWNLYLNAAKNQEYFDDDFVPTSQVEAPVEPTVHPSHYEQRVVVEGHTETAVWKTPHATLTVPWSVEEDSALLGLLTDYEDHPTMKDDPFTFLQSMYEILSHDIPRSEQQIAYRLHSLGKFTLKDIQQKAPHFFVQRRQPAPLPPKNAPAVPQPSKQRQAPKNLAQVIRQMEDDSEEEDLNWTNVPVDELIKKTKKSRKPRKSPKAKPSRKRRRREDSQDDHTSPPKKKRCLTRLRRLSASQDVSIDASADLDDLFNKDNSSEDDLLSFSSDSEKESWMLPAEKPRKKKPVRMQTSSVTKPTRKKKRAPVPRKTTKPTSEKFSQTRKPAAPSKRLQRVDPSAVNTKELVMEFSDSEEVQGKALMCQQGKRDAPEASESSEIVLLELSGVEGSEQSESLILQLSEVEESEKLQAPDPSDEVLLELSMSEDKAPKEKTDDGATSSCDTLLDLSEWDQDGSEEVLMELSE